MTRHRAKEDAWDGKKLDALLVEIEGRVKSGLEDEKKRRIPENESIAAVVGYWMYRLIECQRI